MAYQLKKKILSRMRFLYMGLFLCVGQLKEFQQKSSPASMVGEKGSSTGGAGAKKKRKVKGQSQTDAPSTDRNSPDDVSPTLWEGGWYFLLYFSLLSGCQSTALLVYLLTF